MKTPKILAFVMAGGEGKRLYPLTRDRSKPAVPFGGRYRLVDFVLSNLINSELFAVYLLVQYKSQSLIEHVRRAWLTSPLNPRHFVTVVPPQMRGGPEWFQGTADAVYQNLSLVRRFNPDLVAVFGADHVYRMDLRQMVDFHREREAEVTIACLPVSLSQCASFGVVEADAYGRVRGFQEKPAAPHPMPGDPGRGYVSMGNYFFDAGVLVEALKEAHARGETDFGTHVLPRMLKTRRVYAYNFAENRVPGLKPYETPAYWRDVGSIDAYYAAHRDLLGAEPRFDEFNVEWPLYSGRHLGPVARVLEADIRDSHIAGGALIKGGRISGSVIRREVVVEEGAEIEDCIVMDFTVIPRGARLRRVIVDRYNVLAPGTVIGFDREADARRYHVSDGGVVVVPTGRRELKYVY